jgi:hypothetical protein
MVRGAVVSGTTTYIRDIERAERSLGPLGQKTPARERF